MFDKVTIGIRLAASFALLIACALLLALAGWYGMKMQTATAHALIEQDVRFIQRMANVRYRTITLRRFEKDMFLNVAQPEKVRDYRRQWDESKSQLHENLKLVQGLAQGEDLQRVERMHAELARYENGLQAVQDAIGAGEIRSPEDANRRIDQYKGAIHEMESNVNSLFESANARVANLDRSLDAAEARVSLAIAIVVAIAIALAIALAAVITRSITRPVNAAVRAARAVAAGDLTTRIDSAGTKDETGLLLAALAKMKDDLAAAVAAIQLAADNVSAGSQEIARGNADLSSRTEEQASSLEETASSMEELTSTVKQNAENARQANQLAAGASQVAERGGEVVRNVVTTMSGISEASHRIADIITVIDGIAFQTNILALNAAVEAARAGEQGRGFAVVAAEVRSLAQRSASAAKEIKALIEDSAGRVNDGAKLVDAAGRTMDEVVTSVKQVTDIVSGIAAASHEQLSGIEQVGDAIAQMDQVVQQNAALVEESAAAAENLASQSEALMQTVSRFRLAESVLSVRPHAPAPQILGAASAAHRSRLERKSAPPVPQPQASRAPAVARPPASRRDVEGEWQEF